MSIRTTLVTNEIWLINPSRIRTTMMTNEVWILPSGGNARVTAVNLTVWRTVAGAPLTITGHADGYATVYAISSFSIPVAGQADGYATASQAGPQVAVPILALMAI
jgi:hypothetical protein